MTKLPIACPWVRERLIDHDSIIKKSTIVLENFKVSMWDCHQLENTLRAHQHESLIDFNQNAHVSFDVSNNCIRVEDMRERERVITFNSYLDSRGWCFSIGSWVFRFLMLWLILWVVRHLNSIISTPTYLVHILQPCDTKYPWRLSFDLSLFSHLRKGNRV